MRSEEFIWPVRVFYEDTDSTGLVYHASFLRFMERARTEWLRRFGFELPALRRQYNVIFTVSRLQIDYLMPARFNDMLDVSVGLARLGGASFMLDQDIRRGTEELLCQGKVRIACVDVESVRPRSIPESICSELRRDCRSIPA